MKIRFTGTRVTRRVIGSYVWCTENGFVQDVTEPGLAAELLSNPLEQFAVADDDSVAVLKGIGPQRAAELALEGILTVKDLARLDTQRIIQVADVIYGSRIQITAWVQAARERLKDEAPDMGLVAIEKQEVER